MLDLIDEPNLLDRLSELDEGLLDADARPYVPPPPLIDRLLIPEAEGRWRMNCRQTPSVPDAVDARTAFDTLDAGLLESSATADSVFSRQAEIVRQGRRQHVVYPNARPSIAPTRRATRTVVAAGWMIVMMMTGAATAGLLFHSRLEAAIVRLAPAAAASGARR